MASWHSLLRGKGDFPSRESNWGGRKIIKRHVEQNLMGRTLIKRGVPTIQESAATRQSVVSARETVAGRSIVLLGVRKRKWGNRNRAGKKRKNQMRELGKNVSGAGGGPGWTGKKRDQKSALDQGLSKRRAGKEKFTLPEAAKEPHGESEGAELRK